MGRPDINIVQQGTVLIKPVAERYVVAFPGGDVVVAKDRETASRLARRWFKKRLGNDGMRMGIGFIDWLPCNT